MERLTRRTEQGNVYIPECFKRCDGEGVSEKCRECDIEHTLIYSLAQYEGTDLTPEQILEKLEELEKAKEVIRKLLCSEYGSTCQFCIHVENPDAMCSNIGGSGSWCCENSRWNGKIE